MTVRPTLIIFLKEPRPGRVKTRLAREIGAVRAAWWFRHQTRQLIRRLGFDPRWHTVLAVSPDREGLESRCWPSGIACWPQGRGDLGRRMSRAFATAPPGPVAIIGADVPGITAGHIACAFRRLSATDSVIGPSPDGGYWLIGLRHGGPGIPHDLLDGVRWSSIHAQADTIVCLAPRRIELLESLSDIDRLEDLTAQGINPV